MRDNLLCMVEKHVLVVFKRAREVGNDYCSIVSRGHSIISLGRG